MENLSILDGVFLILGVISLIRLIDGSDKTRRLIRIDSGVIVWCIIWFAIKMMMI